MLSGVLPKYSAKDKDQLFCPWFTFFILNVNRHTNRQTFLTKFKKRNHDFTVLIKIKENCFNKPLVQINSKGKHTPEQKNIGHFKMKK